jgi:hypothetical protein
METSTEKQYIHTRVSGIRILVISVSALLGVFLLYGNIISPTNISHSERFVQLITNLAISVFIFLAASLFGIGYGLYRIGLSERYKMLSMQMLSENGAIRNVFSIIIDILSQRKYLQTFLAISVGYAIFFSFTSQMIIFRPGLSFSHLYNVNIPSWRITTCCSTLPGSMPVFSAYVFDNLIILLIPLNIILGAVLSVLVSVNITLILYRMLERDTQNCSKGRKISSLGGFGGAAAGLFTACPICAGTFFSALIGVITGVSAASAITTAVLTPYQLIFISITIPMLLLSSYFTVKNLQKSGTWS